MNNNRKRILINGCQNLRDLGGYVTQKDTITRWNTIYRGDMILCDEEGWKYLYERLSIRCVIDLRSTAEQQFQPYLYQHKNIQYFSVPLLKEEPYVDADNENDSKHMFHTSIAKNYLDIVFANPYAIVQVFMILEQNINNGAVIFHCTAGKDRTGIIAFFLLWLLQVPVADIMADYQVSSTYAYYGNNSTNILIKELQEYDTSWMHAQPEALGMLIDYFTKHDMKAFLIHMGMPQVRINSLIENLIE